MGAVFKSTWCRCSEEQLARVGCECPQPVGARCEACIDAIGYVPCPKCGFREEPYEGDQAREEAEFYPEPYRGDVDPWAGD